MRHTAVEHKHAHYTADEQDMMTDGGRHPASWHGCSMPWPPQTVHESAALAAQYALDHNTPEPE